MSLLPTSKFNNVLSVLNKLKYCFVWSQPALTHTRLRLPEVSGHAGVLDRRKRYKMLRA